eukprot:51458-Chlamydomonas_euryale.AAC.7
MPASAFALLHSSTGTSGPVHSAPRCSTSRAETCSPRRGCGRPTTAAAATAGCEHSTCDVQARQKRVSCCSAQAAGWWRCVWIQRKRTGSAVFGFKGRGQAALHLDSKAEGGQRFQLRQQADDLAALVPDSKARDWQASQIGPNAVDWKKPQTKSPHPILFSLPPRL